jgi:hypothetical protein
VYSRVLLALSFIKGPNVVNWVSTQFDQLEEDLAHICRGDEDNEELWLEFEKGLKGPTFRPWPKKMPTSNYNPLK